MKLRHFFTSLFFVCSFASYGQLHEAVFPTQSGQTLLNNLVSQYKPFFVLDYSEARDTLFGSIYLVDNNVSCVYSGHSLYLPPNQDPTTALYMNGVDNGINTEHTYPQAFGAGNGNPRSDMHHLYPTRTAVNSARGNSRFAEINDNQTDAWFYLNQETSSIPSQDIDSYSEQTNTAFEPREDHKGNVARAMFYFYTMYKSQADSADPNYFETQRATLCQWHEDDPVDQLEWTRNNKIAVHQGGKKNPFILDCTLAERTYCTNMSFSCLSAPVKNIEKNIPVSLSQNSPNPFNYSTKIDFTLDQSFDVRLSIFNILGEEIKVLIKERKNQGSYQIELDAASLNDLPSGVAFYRLQATKNDQRYELVKKMIVLH